MHRLLKADFHAHSADDPRDPLRYSTEMLIDEAAAHGVEVLALTLHETIQVCPRLTRHAERRNILLLPAIEQCVDGRHLIIINPDPEQAAACTFADLRALGRRNAAFIAPHPYYGLGSCLGQKLIEHIDLFDAIEYCSLYGRGVNLPNRLAARVARRHGLPLVGTSDSHTLPYVSTTHTLVLAEKTTEGIVDALRAGRVELVTRPRPWSDVFTIARDLVRKMGAEHLEHLTGRWPHSHAIPHCYRPGDLHRPPPPTPEVLAGTP